MADVETASPTLANGDRELISGVLHAHIAFDWGDEVDLATAAQIMPVEHRALPRRRRTPPSIEFRSRPLRAVLEPIAMDLPGIGAVRVTAALTIFDFGGVSVAMRVPFSLSFEQLASLARALNESAQIVEAARAAVVPLHRKLLPSIQDEHWSELYEEYFVFQLPPQPGLPPVSQLLKDRPHWLVDLVRLESETFEQEEVDEALRLRIRYSEDLLIPDWPAAVLVDSDCEETLQIIELANLQLLEYRHLDGRLDRDLPVAYNLLRPAARFWFPFMGQSHGRHLRLLGSLKVEASDLFERTGNVLKLVGDQYLARVYRLLAKRFHLDEWEKSIQRKLGVLESTYRILSDQADTARSESLEIAVILLIVVEIVLAVFKH